MVENSEIGIEGAIFRVWWCPQVPMESFLVDVPSFEEGARLCDTLGKYDAFQFENDVKPDYCNAGGVQMNHPLLTDGEWWDIDEDEFAEVCAEFGVVIAEDAA